jgi:hypothetical protein
MTTIRTRCRQTPLPNAERSRTATAARGDADGRFLRREDVGSGSAAPEVQVHEILVDEQSFAFRERVSFAWSWNTSSTAREEGWSCVAAMCGCHQRAEKSRERQRSSERESYSCDYRGNPVDRGCSMNRPQKNGDNKRISVNHHDPSVSEAATGAPIVGAQRRRALQRVCSLFPYRSDRMSTRTSRRVN